MPVTAGHVPGLTSGLRRVAMNPQRFRSGRWFLLAEGVLVTAFAIGGLVFAAVHPHAENTRALVSGVASTPAHSAILLAFGVVAIAAVANRRAAVAVTALSAVGYMMLLFFSSVGAASTMPTPAGSQSAGVLLHGVLAVVNLALLMWLIPDELGDEAWVRRRGRGRDRRQPAPGSLSTVARNNPGLTAPATAGGQESGAHESAPQGPVEPRQPSKPGSVGGLEQPRSQGTNASSADNAESSQHVKHAAARRTGPVLPRAGFLAVAALAAVVGLVIWMRRR